MITTLAGGLGALLLRKHRSWVFGFCSGALIGVAVIFLLPDARQLLADADRSLSPNLVWLCCALGFLFFYLFERGTHGNDHETAEGASIAGWGGAIGIAIHSFFDGIVLGQGFRAEETLGLALALAVMLHRLVDGISTVGVMLGTHHSARQTSSMLLLTAVAPMGGVLAQSFIVLPRSLFALLLSWFAGMLLYLGASKLLPEARRDSDSAVIPFLSLAGVLFVYLAHELAH